MGLKDTISSAVLRNAPTVSLEESLRTAIHKMVETGSSALAVRADSNLVGIVSITDLVTSAANDRNLDETRVSRFMTSCRLTDKGATQDPCIQVNEDETVGTALAVMEKAGVHNLLVSGGNGETIGMISAQGLLKLAIS
jgi:CBS domain-containing protein